MLSTNCQVRRRRALRLKFVFGVDAKLNEKGNVGSGTGVLKLNANLFKPKINSLVTVDVGDQR